MSRFKIGQTVYMGRDYKQKEMVVAKVIDNLLLPVYQYTFEAPHDGFAVGEQSIRATPNGPDLSMSECWKEDHDATVPTRINTLAAATNQTFRMEETGMENIFSNSQLFFRPDREFVKWLVEYAADRLIIDVGAGQGHLVEMVKRAGGKAIGIEPNFDKMAWIEWSVSRNRQFDINEMLEGDVHMYKGLISKLGDKAILVFARPCHGTFVFEAIDDMPDEMEALYITVPENFEKYNDLGPYKKFAKKLEHAGSSEDSEVVFSIKKNG